MIDLVELLTPTSWLFWFAAGTALLVLEALIPTFLALGFGIGAWILSALIYFVLPTSMISLPVALVIWAILSALAWISLRIVFRNRYSGNKASKGDINEY